MSGNVVTGRKGGVFMRHSGSPARPPIPAATSPMAISAIEELARKIQAIHALTDLDRGITLNVGLVRGGQSVNTVRALGGGPDRPALRPARRTGTMSMARIGAIIERSFVPGTKAELTVARRVPADDAERRRRSGCSSSMWGRRGLPASRPTGEFTGGCANSGFTAGVGAPTICAVGPGRRQGTQPGRVPAPRQPGAARAGLRARDPASEQAGL